MFHGALTLTETETHTETDTDKMTTAPNGINVSVQYEQLHTILYKPLFIGLAPCQCERSLNVMVCSHSPTPILTSMKNCL